MKRIATHKRPDPDAIVAAWLAERYLFANDDEVDIVFVGRKRPGFDPPLADCVVDVGNVYDPARLLFDHKPPAFADRNETCATRLIWLHLLGLGRPVWHLSTLVNAIHEGDRNPPGKPGPLLLESRRNGFHAQFARLRSECGGEEARLYAASRKWLDGHAATLSLSKRR